MHLTQLPRLFVVALVATCIAAVPSEAAGKRRSVRKTPATGLLTVDISGTVLDATNNQPVVSARVEVGNSSKQTDSTGKFTMRGVDIVGSTITVQVSRSGYTTSIQQLSSGGTQNLTIRLTPVPTVTVRKTDGSTAQLDTDTIRFGYSIPFSGYRDAEFEEFCKVDGTPVTIDRSQIARINGPATVARHAPCCGNVDTLKVNLVLKSGETMDVYFVDACNGFPNIELLGRDHTTAKAQYIPFTSIAEVVFP
ncbi:MAG TPA: carboxypeptidase regulatory-like domain-containing protein [Thermoanaerobaculia bacterium]|jgi:hypothetical protein